MPFTTKIFTGFNGLNDSTALDSLLPAELTIAENVVFDNRGGYMKGWGRQRHTPTPIEANPIKTIVPFYKKDGTVVKLYACGSKLYKDNGNGSYAVLLDGLVNTELDFFSWVDNKVYFVNGNNYYSTDGTTVNIVTPAVGSDLSGVKRCTIHEFYPSWFRHFFAGDIQDRSALWYSVDSDPTKINSGASGTDKVYPTANLGPITALKIWRDALLVGYKRGFMMWEGGGTNPTITASWKQVKASSGPTSNRAVVVAREVLIYASEDGVYALESNNTATEDNSRKVSKDISTFYKRLINKDKMTATFDGRYLYIGGCDGTAGSVNNVVLVADFDLIEDGQPAWSIFTNCYAGHFLNLDGVTYFGHSQNGLIMKFNPNYYDNDDQPLKMRVQHYFTLNDREGKLNPFAQHKIKSLLIAMQQSSLNATCKVTIECDYKKLVFDIALNEAFEWGLDDWGILWGSNEMLAKEIKLSEKARRIRITIENEVAGESLSIHALGIGYKAGKVKGVKLGVNRTE